MLLHAASHRIIGLLHAAILIRVLLMDDHADLCAYILRMLGQASLSPRVLRPHMRERSILGDISNHAA
jgi:hypothetical protein